jgi:hypothetical protein
MCGEAVELIEGHRTPCRCDDVPPAGLDRDIVVELSRPHWSGVEAGREDTRSLDVAA